MSFALAYQTKTSKIGRDTNTATLAKHSSIQPHINNLNKGSGNYIFHSQETIGDQVVQNILRSNNNTKGFDFSKIAIQPKLKVSQPSDAYEQEADRVAEQVIRMSAASSQRVITTTSTRKEEIDRKCSACGVNKEESEDNNKLDISRNPSASSNLEVSDVISNDIRDVLSSSSSFSLDSSTKAFMESRFGHDFSGVRIHTGEMAARSASSVNSHAYTIGNDIVFNHGQYNSNSHEGQRLLAHELTHVVQQTGSVDRKKSRNPEDIEDDQDLTITRAASKLSGGGVLSRSPILQRDFALEPPRPTATAVTLTEAQMVDAIAFNTRVVTVIGTDGMERLRDVLGISRTPAVVDEEFVNAVVSWQAVQRLTQDGKLGPGSARPLFREIGAENVGRGEIVSGPTYTPSGTITPPVAAGRRRANFRFNAEFRNDPANGIYASCCEVRQFIRWDAAYAASIPGGIPHGGFPAGAPADTWIEDRDDRNTRYGHRTGPRADPNADDEYIDTTGARNQAFGHIYRGRDSPDVAATRAGSWRFFVQVIDMCHGSRRIGSQDFVRVQW